MHVTIVEKRPKNTRIRRVKLLGQLLLSEQTVDEIYVFSDQQIEERQKAIASMKSELHDLTVSLVEVSIPILTIQENLKTYYTSSGGQIYAGDQYDFSENLNSLQHYPNTLIIDCTGYHSVLRDHIQPNNRTIRFIEYVLMWTFVFDDRYECNELCKYYKNWNTQRFQVIPSINNTYITGERQTHITCLITIDENIFNQVSRIKPLTYDYLKQHHREVYDDLNIFLNNLSNGDISKIHFDDTMEIVALPLEVYRAKRTVHTVNNTDINQHWILMGDAAMGGPYFQSISTGFEAAIYFAYLFKHRQGNIQQMLAKYEEYMEKLWLKIQIRSKEIHKNKQILQALCVHDQDKILNMSKIY